MVKSRKIVGVVGLTWLLLGCTSLQAQSSIKPFSLPSTNGDTIRVNLDGSQELTVLYFTGLECPLAKLYAPRMVALASNYEAQSVRFLGINSNQQDSMAELAAFAEEYKMTFPVGKDFNNVIADELAVKRTPEVLVVDKEFRIRYRGRVDDQYMPGLSRQKASREDLKIAIDELLSGQQVATPSTQPEGCLIGRVKDPTLDASITFTNQISRILQKNCIECHREGELGPFAMEDYEEVVGWADMIVETIDNGRMPPWHADPAHGNFLNQRVMPKKEKDLVRTWVANGAPFGDASELPPKQEFVAGWKLPRSPDAVVPMSDRPITIPGDGTVEYQYFVVDPKFKTDKWVSAAEVVPGNRSIVHHSIVFIRPPDGSAIKGINWLAAYVPGQKNLEYLPTRARHIPAGSKLVFQQHYTPDGSPQSDLTKVGLVFADEKEVTEELLTLIAIDQGFELKPHLPNQEVTASIRNFPDGAKLLSVSPHMHYRGKSFAAEINGYDTNSTLVKVPDYDFNWQHTYQLDTPIPLDSVKTISSEFIFDNSSDNPANPKPGDLVTWGDQTWEEMAVAFFDITVSRVRSEEKSKSVELSRLQDSASLQKQVDPIRQSKIEQFVNDFFKRFDSNQDDLIQRSEIPMVMRLKYSDYDFDGVPGLSRTEVTEQASQSFK
ncbi:MAG: redoxin domain-containing protein [Mariniblastus sp.]|nr:redoxin domain-containing protein [Mariniblastus sp.]